ncbi:MAG: c-type cytochrome [Myxococcota bacterium]
MSNDAREIAEYPRRDESLRDGIGEEDNPVPLWFNVTFYGSIVLGILYMIYYLSSGWSSAGQYLAEAEAFDARFAEVRSAAAAAGNPFRGDEAAIAEGSQVFATICAACHKPDGSGLVGPSLVDPYWKYGNDDTSLFASVSEGRPAGMPAWGEQLGTEKIWKALAYMETLPQSDVPGVGAPTGEGGS